MSISKVVYVDENGVSSTWMNVTDTTAVASDVAQTKYFYDAAGDKTLGTASGGGGGTPIPPSDVNFLDYDGTIVEAWDGVDVAGKTALPSNPSHTGLTAQGWNWTLAQIKAQYAANPAVPLYVGQSFVTTSGKTEIDIVLRQGRLSPYLRLGVNGSVDIDWGDGSAHDTVTGTSYTSAINTNHTYSTPGKYTISIGVNSGAFATLGSSTYPLLNKNVSGINNNRVYVSAITAVRFGNNARIGNYSFYYSTQIQYVTIPTTIGAIGNYFFGYASNSVGWAPLPSGITIGTGIYSSSAGTHRSCLPGDATTVPASMYSGAWLTEANLPNSITAIGNGAFNTCVELAEITIPASVASIDAAAFTGCSGLGAIHFKPTSPPAVANSNAFSSLPTDCTIYVPTGYLSAYTTASNYPSSGTYTYVQE